MVYGCPHKTEVNSGKKEVVLKQKLKEMGEILKINNLTNLEKPNVMKLAMKTGIAKWL